jgi:hypothetical protein
MDMTLHNRIAVPLEELKSSGSVSEYLIAWSGPTGDLQPVVTVWCNASEEPKLRQLITGLVGNIAPRSRIAILID